MTKHQFLRLLKSAFFRYFFLKPAGLKPSLLEVLELVEQYSEGLKNKKMEGFINPNNYNQRAELEKGKKALEADKELELKQGRKPLMLKPGQTLSQAPKPRGGKYFNQQNKK